jgi:hypothetical protein
VLPWVNASRVIRLIVNRGPLGDHSRHMADGVPPLDDLDMLRGMAARIKSSRPTDPRAIERVLEAGFARMISLEAELSRLRRNRLATEPGDPTPEQIAAWIGELRDALIELRELAVAPGESRVGYGFVLPGGRDAHAHRN